MVLCAAVNCKTQSGDGVSMFIFPKDKKRRKIWIDRVKRKNFEPSQYAKLCMKHFEDSMFIINPSLAERIGFTVKNVLLTKDAIPTIFNYKSTPEQHKEKKKRKSLAIEKRNRLEMIQSLLSQTVGDSEETVMVEVQADSDVQQLDTDKENTPAENGDCSVTKHQIEPETFCAFTQTYW